MKKGLFISFEGVDGCGKSTQAKLLAEYLQNKGLNVFLTREPGGSDISEKIRSLILDVKNSEMSAHTEAILYAASRAQLVDECLLPALSDGKIVICDRFIDSSIAYQGYARQLGPDYILNLNAHSVSCCMPDHTFFLDYSPEYAKGRMTHRMTTDRLESENEIFFDRVYAGFAELSDRFASRFIKIDVSGTKQETHRLIVSKTEELLARWQQS